MKKVSRALLLVLVFGLVAGLLSSCNKNNGLTKDDEVFGNPQEVARNKEPYAEALVPYETIESALGLDYSSSPYYLSLNGEWDFTLVGNPELLPTGFEKADYSYTVSEYAAVRKRADQNISWGTIQVPSNWEMQGYDVPTYSYNTYPWDATLVPPTISESYNPVGLYRNTITIPSDWDGREIYLTLDGVSSAVYVYVNGSMIGYGEDSFTSKTFRLTELLDVGQENLIVFEVYKYSDSSYLEASDSIKFGGIYRDVYLFSTPKTHIRDFQWDIQMNGKDALVNTTVTISSHTSNGPDGYTVSATIYDEKRQIAMEETQIGSSAMFSDTISTTANAYVSTVGGRLSVKEPKLWNAESPNLYTVVLTLKDENGNVVDIVSRRIGFKTVGLFTDDDGRQTFLLNDQKIILRGVLYNEHSAVNGMALTIEEMTEDIKLMKKLNINAVRSPGRPLSSDFIALCDEYGLYVIDDMSLNSNPYSNKDEQSIPGDQSIWQNAILDRLLNVVYRDKNSASVIMWAIGNDSGTGSSFSVLKNWLLSFDSRLIVYDDDIATSDVVVNTDHSITNLVQLLNDKGNKKAVISQNAYGALLNAGGNFSSYMELVEKYDNYQGGFYAYWADKALYWPTNYAAAGETIQTTPYAENPSLYRLAYAGGWGETFIPQEAYRGLSGILTADRKLQSDAEELKRALSPIYISPIDLKNGEFSVANRHSITKFEDNYEISYILYEKDQKISSGVISDLKLAAGEVGSFKIDYGTLNENSEYFLDIEVRYQTKPEWADDDTIVFSRQYALSENDAPIKDGTVSTPEGDPINVSTFVLPKIYASAYSLSQGNLYISNPTLANYSDLFSLSYVTYEQHAYWNVKRWVIFDEGTVENLDVPGGADYAKITIPNKTTGAARDAKYAMYITLTTKVQVGDIPAGTQFVYRFTDNIPFVLDPARNPVPLIDENGNVIEDVLVPPEIDAEPEESDDDLLELPTIDPDAENVYLMEGDNRTEIEDSHSFILLNNGKLDLKINSATGLIERFLIDGKEVFSSSADGYLPSMLANLIRNQTGGDVVSTDVSASVLARLQSLSSEYEKTRLLPDSYQLEQISDTHYRITLDYIWVTYPNKYYRAFALDTSYRVVYDIYADGQMEISVTYDPSNTATTPIELSTILTLPSEFTKMSWYGRGPGESYSDKAADTRVDIFENETIKDHFETQYLYSTGSGDKTEVRWAAFEREDGSGIVITSDTNLFAFNVGGDYPWNNSAYMSNSSSQTVLRIIAQQRGVSANTLFDEMYTEANYIVPGQRYTYSFRIIPVESGYDAEEISKTVLGTEETLQPDEITLDGSSFAFSNAASSNQFLTALNGILSMSAAEGSESQYWIQETATDLNIANLFRLKNAVSGLYLSPVGSVKTSSPSAIEIGLAEYKGFEWQNWSYAGNQLMPYKVALNNYSLHIMGGEDVFSYSGARLALQLAKSNEQAYWTIIADPENPNRIKIQNTLSGQYLTQVNELTYQNEMLADIADRLRNYAIGTNWNSSDTIAKAIRFDAATYDGDLWVPTQAYVTQWSLLPSETQMWTLRASGNGYMIINNKTGEVLTQNGTTLNMSAATEAGNQIWLFENEDGMFRILNQQSGEALTLLSQNGELVLTVSEWQNLAIQKWDLCSLKDLEVNIEAGFNWFN